MTFQQLADSLKLHILDLIPDEEEAESLRNEELFDCLFTEGLIEEEILNEDLTIKRKCQRCGAALQKGDDLICGYHHLEA